MQLIGLTLDRPAARLAPALFATAVLAACSADVEPSRIAEVEGRAEAVYYEDCNNRQRSELRTFHQWLYDYAQDAAHQFVHGPTLERAWVHFGFQDTPLFEHTRDILQDLPILMQIRGPAFRCMANDWATCRANPDWAAYVNGDDPWSIITVCDRFWDRDNQERLVILAHEYSHFYDTGDWLTTFDLAELHNFALADPWGAATNAQNYAMFIINPLGIPD